MSSFHPRALLCVVALTLLAALASPALLSAAEPAAKEEAGWTSLFDGKTLGGWKSTNFGGEGEVEVKDGQILLPFGSDLTGVTWTKDIPKQNYELELDAMRVDGTDFFCGLTFPFDDTHASLIVGGWGGAVTGISSIDRSDASDNQTTTAQEYENGKWYRIRLRVTPKQIAAWINGKDVVDFDPSDKKLSTREEVNPSKPLGISSWQTSAAIKGIRIRKLEVK